MVGFLPTILFAQTKTNRLESGNPIFKGWYADPEAVVYGKEYWVFPTYSDKYENQVFFDAFSSRDLVHWKIHKDVLDSSNVKWAKKAMWAPAVLKKDKKYYFFFGANDIHPGEVGGIGVAVSDKPQGPYKDLIGISLIDTIVNGAQPIDQFVFKDKDGQYYMYYGGWGHCNVVKLKMDFTGIVPFDDGSLYKEITPKDYVEGPFMFIRNGKYYFMWSEGGWTGPDYKVAYAISDNPFGPFERIGTVLLQDTSIANGAGHHSIIHNPKSDKYYIVYHRRPKGETAANHRETCIEEMKFDKEGKIIPVQITKNGVYEDKL
ncbi:MAG: arabinan endo-1,5-alpha-L-arabinosidase [Pseudopedobacter saltans]|uniref:Arabinan endo-1,5-alpha-L-arabinosidase n=1 Tax=Pseudopedobacter saltans TaxID=151895 RepID=A0A2W5EIX0_9SPHI|nr:MAG: arabinan endo-1,5-alpha-L-arabinosidase [Pseudopedobacter saltans]